MSLELDVDAIRAALIEEIETLAKDCYEDNTLLVHRIAMQHVRTMPVVELAGEAQYMRTWHKAKCPEKYLQPEQGSNDTPGAN